MSDPALSALLAEARAWAARHVPRAEDSKNTRQFVPNTPEANRRLRIGYVSPEQDRIVRPMAHAGVAAGYLDETEVRWDDTPMGWGPMGIKTVPLGVNQAQVAALKAGQVQGFVASSSLGYVLEKAGQGRVLVEFGDHLLPGDPI